MNTPEASMVAALRGQSNPPRVNYVVTDWHPPLFLTTLKHHHGPAAPGAVVLVRTLYWGQIPIPWGFARDGNTSTLFVAVDSAFMAGAPEPSVYWYSLLQKSKETPFWDARERYIIMVAALMQAMGAPPEHARDRRRRRGFFRTLRLSVAPVETPWQVRPSLSRSRLSSSAL